MSKAIDLTTGITIAQIDEVNAEIRKISHLISQAELNEIFDLQVQCKALEQVIKDRKEIVRLKIKAGYLIEPGTYTARIMPGRITPKWKDEFVLRLGADAALNVIQNTPASTTDYVVVESIKGEKK